MYPIIAAAIKPNVEELGATLLSALAAEMKIDTTIMASAEVLSAIEAM